MNEQELKWIMSTLENTNGQCVLLSLSGEMLTAISDSCSTSNGFICEITGMYTFSINAKIQNLSYEPFYSLLPINVNETIGIFQVLVRLEM